MTCHQECLWAPCSDACGPSRSSGRPWRSQRRTPPIGGIDFCGPTRTVVLASTDTLSPTTSPCCAGRNYAPGFADMQPDGGDGAIGCWLSAVGSRLTTHDSRRVVWPSRHLLTGLPTRL